MKRYSGVLLSITSLPSKYGIGCFDKAAYDFVDWLEEAGQRYSAQIASRLYGEFTRLTFIGEDIRVKKNRLF